MKKKSILLALSLSVGSLILNSETEAKFSCNNNVAYDCQECWKPFPSGVNNPHCHCPISCPSAAGYPISLKCGPICVKDEETASALESLSKTCPNNTLSIGNGCETIFEGCADGQLRGIWERMVLEGQKQTYTWYDRDGGVDGSYQYYTLDVQINGKSYTLAANKPENNSDGTSMISCPSPMGP